MKYKEYYNRLWDWIEKKDVGSYEIAKFVNPKNMEWFEEIIKVWIRTDEFRVFNFQILFSNDYKSLIKRDYSYDRMKYLETLT